MFIEENNFCPSICFDFVEIAANIYSEMREEARDHARLRNAYFEQVCGIHDDCKGG